MNAKICPATDCDHELMDPNPAGEEAGTDTYYCEGCGRAWEIKYVLEKNPA